MEDQTVQNQSPFNTQISVPNAVAVLVLGICSIALSCTGLIGLAGGIVALILGGKATTAYNENPDAYTQASYSQVKAGRICGIIGLILSGIMLIYWIVFTIAAASSSYYF